MRYIELLKGLNMTTTKKEFHKTKIEEVRQLLNTIYDSTGYYFILPDHNEYFLSYVGAIKNYSTTTKSELDKLLKLVITGGYERD